MKSKRNCGAVVLFWFLGTWAHLFAQPGANSRHETVPLLVDNQAVSSEEFRWFMEQERAGVFREVQKKCKIDYGKDFWNHECVGTTPKAMLLKKTIDRIARDKVQQLLFKELGLTQDIRYSSFLENLEKLNSSRELAARQGQVLYGPVRYTPLQYYGHQMATLQIQAKEKLSLERFGVTDEKLRAFYEASKNQAFRTLPNSTLEIVTVRGTQRPVLGTLSANMESTISEILSEMHASHDFDSIRRHFAGRSEPELSFERFDEVNDDRSGELFPNDDAVRRVRELAAGESARITVSDSEVMVVRCVSRSSGHYIPYDENRDLVKARYLDQAYEKLVEKMVADADVRVNHELLDSIVLGTGN